MTEYDAYAFAFTYCAICFILIFRAKLIGNIRVKAAHIVYQYDNPTAEYDIEHFESNGFYSMMFDPIKWTFAQFYPHLANR